MDIQQLKEIVDTLDAIKKDLVKWEADSVDQPIQNRIDILLDEAVTHVGMAMSYVERTLNVLRGHP